MAMPHARDVYEPIEILPTPGRSVLNVVKGAVLYSQRTFRRGLGLWRLVDLGTRFWTNWASCPVVGPDAKPLLMDLRGMGFGVITQGYLLGEIVPLLEYFPKDAVVLDIGSNIGVWSRMFAQRVPDGKVFAFEPSPSTFQLLVKNCSEYPNIVCVPSALGAESGTIGFCEDMEPALRYVVSKPNGAKATTSVPVSRLDDWVSAAGLTRIDFIKIDVEGAEEELIDGAIATLERLQPTILFEFIPWVAQERSKFKGRMIFATLGKLGYRLLRIDRDGFLYENFMNPEEWTNDYLAVPPSSRFRPAVDKLLKV